MPTLQEIKKRQQYIAKANQTEEKYGLPKNLLVGVMGAESNFNPNAVSPVGAKGLMQFMKATAQEYGINPLNPSESIDAAGKYLASSYKKFGNWEDSLRSYNMGVGGLQKVKAGKMKMPKETQDYVGRVYKNAGIKYESPEDASYANSVAPYMNQPTPTINNFDIPKQTTTFASVPDSVEKESKTEEDKDVAEVEQKTKEFNFLDELNTTAASFKLREKQQIEAPQTDYMQQYEQISQFVENPQVAQQGKTVKDDKSRMIAHFMRLGIDVPREKVKVFPEAEVTPAFNFGWQPPKKKIEITDKREINATTGKPINPNVDLTTGKYNQDTIRKIVVAANKIGIDPYTALSIGLQETKLGTTDENIGHTIGRQDVNTKDIKSSEEYFVNVLKSKMDYANKLGIKDEDTILQTYNGLGKVYPETEQNYHGFKMKKVYGVDVPKEGIDMRKNPLYGKRIVDLRDNVLKQNPELVDYVDSVIGEVNPFSGKRETETYGIPKFQQGGNFTENELAFLSEIAIKDNNGYWNKNNQGKVVEIDGGNITMKGVDQDIIGISKQTGEKKIMKPNKNYTFSNTKSVIEIPFFKK